MNRRAVILLSVLLVVAIAALAGTTAMYYGQAAGTGTAAALKRTRLRALAWSGIQGLLAELSDQREKLLDGEPPLVTTQWQLFEDANGVAGTVRLIALERDDAGLEKWVVSENAKLDLNIANAEMLAALPTMTKELGEAIVSARGNGFTSVEELCRVPGITPESLRLGLPPDGSRDATSRTESVVSLLSILTVFSFDPSIQAGFDPGAPDHKGKTRVNLNVAWSDELAEAIRARFGEAAVTNVKSLIEKGSSFKTVADIVGQLRLQKVPPAAWPVFLDAFECSPDPFIRGRVDLNLASAAVLAAIPGVSKEAADEIVRRRSSIESGLRRSIAWPVAQGILKEDNFVKACNYLCARSTQWRARIEVGTMTVRGESSGKAAPLQDRMAFDVVIDIASNRPRVAYLRDVSIMEAARIMDESLASGEGRSSPAAEELGTSAAQPMEAARPDTGLKFSSALNFDEEPPAEPSTPVSQAPETTAEPATAVDRRIGRWTTKAAERPKRPQGGGTS